MNKAVTMICMSIGSAIGGVIPWMFGDHDMLSGWVFLGGLVGGVIGVWVGVKLARQFS
ncbi:MAG: hypothetical protein WAQ25_04760 [Candidatus Saccharimonas sp.]